MNEEKDNEIIQGNIRIISKETGKENFYEYQIIKKEEKDLYEKMKELIMENKFKIILIGISAIYYLINLTYNISKKNEFNLPFEYFKTDLAESLFYIGFFIIFPLSFFIVSEKFVNEDEFNKKLLKLETIIITFVFGVFLSHEFANITMLIIFLIFFVILTFILFKKNILEKIKKVIYLFYFIIYIILIVYHLIIISSNKYQILKIGDKEKVVITIYEGKYLIMDCDIENKELKIHKDSYNFIEINSSKIERIQYMKFDSIK